jgi:hypothetical protein
MRIDVSSNSKAVLKGMEQHARQAPYAISRALNDTADELTKAETTEIKLKVDRPTPFTMRTWAMQRSSKARLMAVVYARDIQAEYLRWQVEGGIRGPKKRAIPIPQHKSIINQYGNITNKGIAKRYSNKKKYFSGVPKGGKYDTPGLYERMGKGGRSKMRLIASWEDKASYSPMLDFNSVANRLVQQRFEVHLRKRIAEAVASAR